MTTPDSEQARDIAAIVRNLPEISDETMRARVARTRTYTLVLPGADETDFAGIFTYELHTVRGFPGAELP